MDACTHRFKHTSLFVGEPVIQFKDRIRPYFGIFGKGTILSASKKCHMLANFLVIVLAKITVIAGNMRFHRYAVPHLDLGYIAAYGNDVSGRFMADNHRRDYAAGRPGIPIVNMHVCTADSRHMYLDEHFIVVDLRHRKIGTIRKTGAGFFFRDAAHILLHHELPPFPIYYTVHYS